MIEKEKAHAKFSCSASKRWMNCYGSIALTMKAPPKGSSEHADQGTEAHACFEYLFQHRKKRLQAADYCRKKWGVQMTVHAESTLNEVLKRAPEGAELQCETEADLRYIDKNFWGTFDAAIIEPFGRLTVIDYKYGFQPVEPDENSQLISYALATSAKYDHNFSEICLVIIQPNSPHEKGPVREWVTDVDTLMKWEAKFATAIKRCKEKDAPLKADDDPFGWCKYCPAAAICPELSTRALKNAQIAFAPESARLDLPTPQAIGALAPSNLGRTLSACMKIKAWISGVEKHAYSVLEKGDKVDGWKLVERRSTRYWLAPSVAAKEANAKFGNEAFTAPELLSPAQLEKLAGKDWVNKRVSNVSSGLTLVPDGDRRKGTNALKLAFGKDAGHEKRGKGNPFKRRK